MHGLKDVGQAEIHTAESTVPEPSASEVELAIRLVESRSQWTVFAQDISGSGYQNIDELYIEHKKKTNLKILHRVERDDPYVDRVVDWIKRKK